jgi:hypothetical protein
MPCGVVCAFAPAIGSETAPATATNIAAVLIDIIMRTQNLFEGRNVSDCRAKVNCARANQSQNRHALRPNPR